MDVSVITPAWANLFPLCAPLPHSPQWPYLLTLHSAEKEAGSIPCPLLRTQATGEYEHGWSGHGLNTQTLYTQNGSKAHKYTHKHTHVHAHSDEEDLVG